MMKKIATLVLATCFIVSSASADMVAQDIKQTDSFYNDVQYVLSYNIMKNKFVQPEYNRYEFRPYESVQRFELAGSFLKFRNMMYWNELKPLQDQDKILEEKVEQVSNQQEEIQALQVENKELKTQLADLNARLQTLEENAKQWNLNKPVTPSE
ncbi:hypothetical protein J7I80_05620 [Bacillus sp. ISL-41]|uniref:hypothetical protein n=1 Tax=Bacillus sp. ISL-41 TaxID=2819127 RepID=UPI001BEC8F03|nr:hypothetical protein [Bacillus sp. ISL-41]MBT2641693.1 hypothetical protein [Bacillus sp. ISL-41]